MGIEEAPNDRMAVRRLDTRRGQPRRSRAIDPRDPDSLELAERISAGSIRQDPDVILLFADTTCDRRPAKPTALGAIVLRYPAPANELPGVGHAGTGPRSGKRRRERPTTNGHVLLRRTGRAMIRRAVAGIEAERGDADLDRGRRTPMAKSNPRRGRKPASRSSATPASLRQAVDSGDWPPRRPGRPSS